MHITPGNISYSLVIRSVFTSVEYLTLKSFGSASFHRFENIQRMHDIQIHHFKKNLMVVRSNEKYPAFGWLLLNHTGTCGWHYFPNPISIIIMLYFINILFISHSDMSLCMKLTEY